jgi:FkbM family methyltransferase
MKISYNFVLKFIAVFLAYRIYLAFILALYDILFFASRFFPRLNLRRALYQHAIERDFNHCFSSNKGKELSLLLPESNPLVYLSIGARGDDKDQLIANYANRLRVILCEPEPIEANRLRGLNFTVIDQPLSNEVKKSVFFHCADATKSSMYIPDGPFIDYFNSSPQYLKQWAIIKEEILECSTIGNSLIELKFSKLDLLKLDVQGGEFDVLRGLGDFRPIIMIIETHFMHLYSGIESAYEMFDYLYRLGYIPAQIGPNFNGGVPPSVTDVIFMPNWTTIQGREIILGRELEYAALMAVIDQISILKFVANKLNFKNKKIIYEIFSTMKGPIFE